MIYGDIIRIHNAPRIPSKIKHPPFYGPTCVVSALPNTMVYCPAYPVVLDHTTHFSCGSKQRYRKSASMFHLNIIPQGVWAGNLYIVNVDSLGPCRNQQHKWPEVAAWCPLQSNVFPSTPTFGVSGRGFKVNHCLRTLKRRYMEVIKWVCGMNTQILGSKLACLWFRQ
jgi:hypothetical protein